MKNKIIYVWDPMCGWCYGFEPQMEKFQEKYRDEYDFEVIIGGMVLPPNGHSMAQMRGFLQGAIPQLEKTTGVKISEKYHQQILTQDSLTLYSTTPSFIFNYLKNDYKGHEVELANTIQKMLFVEGLNTNDIEIYKDLIIKSGHDFDQARKLIESEENKKATSQMFEQARKLGVTGYPTVLLENSKGIQAISRGYTTFERLQKQL